MNESARGEAHADTSRWWANAALALGCCFWGTGFLFGKIAFREMTVSENVTYRLLVGCIVLAPIALRRKSVFRARSTRDVCVLLAASIVGFPVQFLVQFKGLELTTVSHASLIVGTLPVLVALTSVLFLHERLKGIEWGVLMLSPIGAVLIALSNRSTKEASGPTLMGDLVVLASMIAATAMILLSKQLMQDYDSLEITAWMAIIGTVVLLVWVESSHPVGFHFSRDVWFAAAAQGLIATAGAYIFWNWGLARVPASRAGVFLNLEPLVGACLGIAVLHETLGRLAVLGGAMILGPAIYFGRKG